MVATPRGQEVQFGVGPAEVTCLRDDGFLSGQASHSLFVGLNVVWFREHGGKFETFLVVQ